MFLLEVLLSVFLFSVEPQESAHCKFMFGLRCNNHYYFICFDDLLSESDVRRKAVVTQQALSA